MQQVEIVGARACPGQASSGLLYAIATSIGINIQETSKTSIILKKSLKRRKALQEHTNGQNSRLQSRELKKR